MNLDLLDTCFTSGDLQIIQRCGSVLLVVVLWYDVNGSGPICSISMSRTIKSHIKQQPWWTTVKAYIDYDNKDETLRWLTNHGGAVMWLVATEHKRLRLHSHLVLVTFPITWIITTIASPVMEDTSIWWGEVADDGEENGLEKAESPLTAHSFRSLGGDAH